MVNPLTSYSQDSDPSKKGNILFVINDDGSVSGYGIPEFLVTVFGCNSFGRCTSCPTESEKEGRDLLNTFRNVVDNFSSDTKPSDAACAVEKYSHVDGFTPNMIYWATAEISNDDWKTSGNKDEEHYSESKKEQSKLNLRTASK